MVLTLALCAPVTVHAQATLPEKAGTSPESLPEDEPSVAEDVSESQLQDLPPNDLDDDTAGGEAANEIVVTGTNISGVENVGSETLRLTREDVLATGKSTVAEVLRTLPQVQTVSGGFGQGTPNGGGATRGNAINLRGLGQGATLTLVDGHRVTPSGTASAFTEANQVPLAAVERIDVIVDGASAIYGSDAIAGVVNYVLRKDFEGLELGGRYTFGDFDNDEWALSATAGTFWDVGGNSGNILLSYEHSDRSTYLRGLNPRLREDQRPYGGIDNRITFASGPFAAFPAGSPGLNGNVLVRYPGGAVNPGFPQGGSFVYYTLPENPTGAPLTAADLRRVDVNCAAPAACTDYPNVTDASYATDYIGAQTRDQLAVFLNQDLGGISFYDEFFYTRSKQKTRPGLFGGGATNGTPVVRVAPDNPNYIPGIADGTLVVQMNLAARGLEFVNDNPEESFNNTFGARARLFSDWSGEAYYTYGQNEACGICYLGNYISFETNAAASIFGEPILGLGLQSAIQNAVDSGLINPFSTAPISQEAKDYILGTNSQYSQNYSHDVVVKFDGSLLEIPGGTIKAAIGGEYYYGIQKLQNGANRPPDAGPVFTPDANARTTREQYAAFGELYLPLIGYDMDVPLVQEFIVSAAIRYDQYSDFGSTTNPKVSATWEVSDDLSFRGSYGTSFRAPGLPELNAGVFSVGLGFANAVAPGITGVPQTCDNGNCTVNTLYIIGNNPNLQAEKGTNWQLGVDLTPRAIPGLRASATYYNITYENKLGATGVPANPFTSAETYNQFQGLVIPLDPPAGCVNSDPSTYDPALLEYHDFLYAAAITYQPRNYCGLQAVVDGRTVSAAEAFQDGMDFNLQYTTSTGPGTFDLGANVNLILNSTQVTTLGGPEVDILDTLGNPISVRGRGNIGYRQGIVFATLFANYTGGYSNNQPLSVLGVIQPETEIGSWTTFDLSVGVNLPEDSWRALGGTRVSLNVTNLFDNDPPVVLTSGIEDSSIDLYAHNALGRFVQLQVTKAF
ncbi:TonB-dependent receptor domain-containing protein [Altericroceibacterium xinjiangense]|uniref:TonB-dependent receptor domain-containing protein n=1 Tax=Altericroceibacterium xinjiangense TaxID=762261 RepID=UPI0013DF2E09|nr:TonB-dependent receptor [Altericroceibacterium xinjiangense]